MDARFYHVRGDQRPAWIVHKIILKAISCLESLERNYLYLTSDILPLSVTSLPSRKVTFR